MSAEIIILGSLNIDFVISAERIPEPGETLAGQSFVIVPGGKGANQAVAVSKLGGKVTMIGRVGSDNFGEMLKENLTTGGVDISNVISDQEESTGAAFILVDAFGENRIVTVAGANGRVNQSDVDSAEEFISQAKIIVLQMEIPQVANEHIINMANKYEVPVLLNVAPAYPIPDELIRKTRYLVLNEIEATIVSDLSVTDLKSAKIASASLIDRGADIVIITLGKNGVLFTNKVESHFIPSYSVDVKDTTAAGDAFIGGFVAELIRTGQFLGSLHFANAAGALATTKLGAQSSLPTQSEVEEFLRDRAN